MMEDTESKETRQRYAVQDKGKPGYGKLSLGLLVALVCLWSVSEMLFLDIFGIGRYNTRKKFPEVAKKMGLNADAKWSNRVFPKFQGRYKGHRVTIDHEMARIRVDLPSIDGLILNTYGQGAAFDTGNETIDHFFKEREVPPCLMDEMTGRSELLTVFEVFIKKWRRAMRKLDIEYQYVECRMRYGNGHYIPAAVAEPLTMDLIEIAGLLEKACPQAETMP
jgi:hypothetical protein